MWPARLEQEPGRLQMITRIAAGRPTCIGFHYSHFFQSIPCSARTLPGPGLVSLGAREDCQLHVKLAGCMQSRAAKKARKPDKPSES